MEAGATDDQAKAEAAAIIRNIPGMLPEDPAGAAVIADAMAEAYAGAVNGNDGRAERVEGDMTQEEAEKLYVLHGTSYVVLGSLHGGSKKIITDFISPHDQKKLDFIKKQPRAAKPGENKGG